MAGLRERHCEPEIMDQPGLDPEQHGRALDALARVNLLSFTANALFGPLVRFQRDNQIATLRVLDVASGGGDVSGRLARMAKARGLDWRISGCDISPVAVEHARRRWPDVNFFQHDALNQPIPPEYDAIICSLFLHHLSNEQAVHLLRVFADSAARLVLVSDLDRSRFGLWMAHLITRLITRSHVVHYDGPVSVRAAFQPREARALARQAGMNGAVVERSWPFRWLLTWRRP